MKKYLIATYFFISMPALSAIQCGPFNVQVNPNWLSINADKVQVAGIQFYGAPRDYSYSSITLTPTSITAAGRQYRITARGGNATLELLTKENPPRILNRELCDSGLDQFNF